MGSNESVEQKLNNTKADVIDQYKKKIKTFPKRHFSIVLGYSTHGKDTFIFNLDETLHDQKFEGQPVLKFGDLIESCTTHFRAIEYRNESILGPGKTGVVLNTVGLGDSSIKENSHKELFRSILMEAGKHQGRIDVLYFVVSLSAEPPHMVNNLFNLAKQAFGEDIFKTSVVILTKGNQIAKIKDRQMRINIFQQLARKFGLLNVVEFEGFYFPYGNLTIKMPTGNDLERQHNWETLLNVVINLPHYDFFPYLNNLVAECKKIEQQYLENSISQKLVNKIETKKFEPLWKIVYFYKTENVYITEIYTNYLTKIPEEIQKEAINKFCERFNKK